MKKTSLLSLLAFSGSVLAGEYTFTPGAEGEATPNAWNMIEHWTSAEGTHPALAVSNGAGDTFIIGDGQSVSVGNNAIDMWAVSLELGELASVDPQGKFVIKNLKLGKGATILGADPNTMDGVWLASTANVLAFNEEFTVTYDNNKTQLYRTGDELAVVFRQPLIYTGATQSVASTTGDGGLSADSTLDFGADGKLNFSIGNAHLNFGNYNITLTGDLNTVQGAMSAETPYLVYEVVSRELITSTGEIWNRELTGNNSFNTASAFRASDGSAITYSGTALDATADNMGKYWFDNSDHKIVVKYVQAKFVPEPTTAALSLLALAGLAARRRRK